MAGLLYGYVFMLEAHTFWTPEDHLVVRVVSRLVDILGPIVILHTSQLRTAAVEIADRER
jgi:hypothetical protein